MTDAVWHYRTGLDLCLQSPFQDSWVSWLLLGAFILVLSQNHRVLVPQVDDI